MFIIARTTLVLEYAIWFHDAVYDPRAIHGVNEEQSVSLAYEFFHQRNYPFNVRMPAIDMIRPVQLILSMIRTSNLP